MRTLPHKSLIQLVELFEDRGMLIEDKQKASEKLKFISYYKLKELAYPFSINNGAEIQYKDITFNTIITRYYQDKKLRIALMSCIEKIEIAFKTRFSYHMGENYGEYGYYNFNNWCNKNKYCVYYLSEKQGDFKKDLKENQHLYKSENVRHHFNDRKEFDYKKIPIWLYADTATFGEVLRLYSLMSETNRRRISNDFDCTPTEFESWLGTVKYIRNQISHNTSIIDLRLRTKPKLRDEWKQFVNLENNQSVGGLADAIIIIIYFTIKINELYTFNQIQGGINRLVGASNDDAQKLGFKDAEVAKNIIYSLGGRFRQKCKEKEKNHNDSD